MSRPLNLTLRILAGVLLFCGALGSVAAIVVLAEGEMEAFWLLSFSLMAIELAVPLRRLSQPVPVPAALGGCLRRALIVLRFMLVLGVAGAFIRFMGGRRFDPKHVAFPLAVVLVWIVVWRRTRPATWEEPPREDEET